MFVLMRLSLFQTTSVRYGEQAMSRVTLGWMSANAVTEGRLEVWGVYMNLRVGVAGQSGSDPVLYRANARNAVRTCGGAAE